LIDNPPIPGPHPNELDDKIKQRIIELSLAHPAFGYQRVADQLNYEGICVYLSSVSNVWIKNGSGTRYKRLLRMEKSRGKKPFKLTEEQIRLIEKAKPCFKECHVESHYPGQLLSSVHPIIGKFEGLIYYTNGNRKIIQ
jgi:hypothetical protein